MIQESWIYLFKINYLVNYWILNTKNIIFITNFNSKFSYVKVLFNLGSPKLLKIEDKKIFSY